MSCVKWFYKYSTSVIQHITLYIQTKFTQERAHGGMTYSSLDFFNKYEPERKKNLIYI